MGMATVTVLSGHDLPVPVQSGAMTCACAPALAKAAYSGPLKFCCPMILYLLPPLCRCWHQPHTHATHTPNLLCDRVPVWSLLLCAAAPERWRLHHNNNILTQRR